IQYSSLILSSSKLSLAFDGFQGRSAPAKPRPQANPRAIWNFRMPKTNHLDTIAHRSSRDQRHQIPQIRGTLS
ncbi:hypothetical protein PQX77_002364, partial [Marasmius sp. AFHP31]